MKRHTVTALVQNEAGTINRVVSLFRRRGFSLASFNAGDCERPGFSRMTFLVDGDDAVLQQVLRQLEKLIDVVECEDLEADERIMREVVLVSFDPAKLDRPALDKRIAEFGAKVEHSEPDCFVLSYTGPVRLVEDFLRQIEEGGFSVREITRSGPVALRVAGQAC
jgi:acetolactate synthase-1/3 small subunit